MKVVHCKKDVYDVYIGRPSKWGNPFSHKKGTRATHLTDTREEAVSKYKEYLLNNRGLLKDLYTLKGKTLGCWCAPEACHGDVLVELANDENFLKLVEKYTFNKEALDSEINKLCKLIVDNTLLNNKF